jgi:hypothetical protein
VGDELIPGAALLVRVALTREDEGVFDRLAVERTRGGAVAVAAAGVEFLDQREEVAEEGALLVGEAGGDRVDRQRLVVGRGRSDLGVAAPVGRDRGLGLVGPYGCLRLSRYRSPSS